MTKIGIHIPKINPTLTLLLSGVGPGGVGGVGGIGIGGVGDPLLL